MCSQMVNRETERERERERERDNQKLISLHGEQLTQIIALSQLYHPTTKQYLKSMCNFNMSMFKLGPNNLFNSFL